MKILVGCECSGRVRDAFISQGHEAYSCDIKPDESGSKYHIQDDIFSVLSDEWDLFIAFPPCTHLAVSGAAWFEQKRKDGRQAAAIDFFLRLANAPVNRVSVENPVGIMSRIYRKPDQIIQPFYFGDEYQKTTCLWLKNLPPLLHSAEDDLFFKKTHVQRGEFKTYADGTNRAVWFNQVGGWNEKGKAAASEFRSRTFPGIANAMGQQWGALSPSLSMSHNSAEKS